MTIISLLGKTHWLSIGLLLVETVNCPFGGLPNGKTSHSKGLEGVEKPNI